MLACWQIDGVDGRALALLDVIGKLRIHIVANSNTSFGIASEAKLTDARNVLALLWGGTPANEPRQLLRRSWEWHGPDGSVDSDLTTTSVAFEAEPKSGQWLPREIFVKTGVPFEKWQKLTSDKPAVASGWLTRREAMAAALQQIDTGEIRDCPADISGASFRRVSRNQLGWHLELETMAEPAKRFVSVGIADRTRRTTSSWVSPQPCALPATGDCEMAEAVRSWPEYKAAVARARADEKTFQAACANIRGKIAAAIAAIRPDLKDCARHLVFGQDGWRTGAGFANYVDSAHDRVPAFTFTFEYGDSPSRLTTALMILRPAGDEPGMRDEEAWKRFGISTLDKVLGVEPRAYGQKFSSSHNPPPPPDPANAQMTVDSMEMWWIANLEGREISLPRFWRVQRYANGNYNFYWSSYAPSAEIDAALQAVRDGLPVSDNQAAKIAVKTALLRYPDLSLDDWSASTNQLQFAPFGGVTLRPTFTQKRTSVLTPSWRIVLRQFSNSLRYIEASVDATTGDVLDLKAKTVPVE